MNDFCKRAINLKNDADRINKAWEYTGVSPDDCNPILEITEEYIRLLIESENPNLTKGHKDYFFEWLWEMIWEPDERDESDFKTLLTDLHNDVINDSHPETWAY